MTCPSKEGFEEEEGKNAPFKVWNGRVTGRLAY